MMFLYVALKRFISGHGGKKSRVFVFSAVWKNLSSQFFDLDIENSLGGGTFAKIESSMYDAQRTGPRATAWADNGITDVPIHHKRLEFAFFLLASVANKQNSISEVRGLGSQCVNVWGLSRVYPLYSYITD